MCKEQVNDSIYAIKDSIQHTEHTNNNVWVCIVVAGIVMFFFLFYVLKNNYMKQQIKKKVMRETSGVDFTDITHDWEKSKLLYDLLKKECHPDRFSDDLKEEATRIFQQVINNKYKYQKLLLLKDEAIEKLGIEIAG